MRERVSAKKKEGDEKAKPIFENLRAIDGEMVGPCSSAPPPFPAPAALRAELLAACALLNERCLAAPAKWAAEQLTGAWIRARERERREQREREQR